MSELVKRKQKQSKQWIDANVWDGEDCTGRDHSAIFAPDDLQELIDDLVEDLFTEESNEGGK